MNTLLEIVLGIICGLMLSIGIFVSLNNYLVARWLAKKKWVKRLLGDKR